MDQAETCMASQDDTSMPLRCVRFAEENPTDFLTYFRAEWKKYGASVVNNASAMAILRGIQVLCENGERYPLSRLYLPTPKLVFIRNRYMLGNEKFRFVRLDKARTNEELESWDFLPSHFGVGIKDDLHFYLRVLYCIQQQNSSGDVDFPHRILELYLRIHSTCTTSSDESWAQERVRKAFQKYQLNLVHSSWVAPSECTLEGGSNWLPTHSVLPPPDSWEATIRESGILKEFYQKTLNIPLTYSWADTVALLCSLRGSTDIDSCKRAQKLFGHLACAAPHVLQDDILKLWSKLETECCICVIRDGLPTWHKLSNCIWAPDFDIPTKVDLSKDFEESKSLFTTILRIPKYEFGAGLKKLLDLDPDHTPVQDAKEMLLQLADLLPKQENLLDPAPLLRCRVFPVRNKTGTVTLSSISAEFFILDTYLLEQGFLGHINALDFTLEEVRRLEPFFSWTGLGNRYLSNNVQRVSYLYGAYLAPIDRGFTSEQARGLVCIAKHFQSPRASSVAEREDLREILNKAQFFQTGKENLGLEFVLKGSRLAPSSYETTLGNIHLEECDGQLRIVLRDVRGAFEFCLATVLPRELLRWMMKDHSPLSVGKINEAALSAVKSILAVPDALIQSVLIQEGIGEGPTPNQTSSISALVEGRGEVIKISSPPSSSGRRIITPRSIGKRRDIKQSSTKDTPSASTSSK